MSWFRNEESSKAGSSSDAPSPMKQVQTPQMPTQEQRDGGDKHRYSGGTNNGKDR